MSRAGSPAQPRVYLIDASIYVFRAWHVLPADITDDDGHPVNAVHGFADFLARFLGRSNPSHVAVCFDESLTHSARNTIYPPYKANREPAPAELVEQFRRCRALTRAAGLAEFASDRHEADDLIATLAGSAARASHPVTIVTGDKDLAQLVADDGYWWDFARDQHLDARGVERKFGVRPDQIADLLALAGDRIDNIPGVPGIGPPTAARLLVRWDDLDTLYANLDGVARMKFRGASRIARLLAEHEDTVRLARRLTGMLLAEDLPTDIGTLRRRTATSAALTAELAANGIREGHREWLAERLLRTRATTAESGSDEAV